MTHIDAINAYRAIESLSQKTKGQTAYDLFKLKLALKPIYDFQTEEENKLIEKYDAQVTPNGEIIVSDERRAEFDKDFKDLRGMKADIDPIETQLPPDIIMQEIEALYGFVNFV